MDILSWQTSSAASYQNEKRARIALDIKKTRQHKNLLNVLFIINIINLIILIIIPFIVKIKIDGKDLVDENTKIRSELMKSRWGIISSLITQSLSVLLSIYLWRQMTYRITTIACDDIIDQKDSNINEDNRN